MAGYGALRVNAKLPLYVDEVTLEHGYILLSDERNGSMLRFRTKVCQYESEVLLTLEEARLLCCALMNVVDTANGR